MSDFINKILKQIPGLGEDLIETLTHKAKLSTIFDIFTEKVIPTFVNENDLKEYYEKRMEEVNEFIYKI
jgi:hypothetical protein